MTKQEKKAYIRGLREQMSEISKNIILSSSKTPEERAYIHGLQDEYNRIAKIRMDLDI